MNQYEAEFNKFMLGLVYGFILSFAFWFPLGMIAGYLDSDRAWTRYVIENGVMEWHCDSKTGETVLRWKE